MAQTKSLTAINLANDFGLDEVSLFQKYLNDVRRFPLLTPAEERELAFRWKKKEDRQAAHTLLTSNLRFVIKIAFEYVGYAAKVTDLIQEGNVGLMQALKKYDPDKGTRFISYAVWWIRAYIQNFIMKTHRLVKVGTTQAQRKLFYKLKQLKNTYLKEHYHDGDSNSETRFIAQKLNVDEQSVREMSQRLASSEFSLDEPISYNHNNTLKDTIPSTNKTPEESFIEDEYRRNISKNISQLVDSLPERDQIIVKKRLMADEPASLQELGDFFGITKERVRQLEKKIKLKLKDHLADIV